MPNSVISTSVSGSTVTIRVNIGVGDNINWNVRVASNNVNPNKGNSNFPNYPYLIEDITGVNTKTFTKTYQPGKYLAVLSTAGKANEDQTAFEIGGSLGGYSPCPEGQHMDYSGIHEKCVPNAGAGTGSGTGGSCTQVITRAYNPNTCQVKDYGTPCDVPAGWIKGDAPASCSPGSGTGTGSETAGDGSAADTGSAAGSAAGSAVAGGIGAFFDKFATNLGYPGKGQLFMFGAILILAYFFMKK